MKEEAWWYAVFVFAVMVFLVVYLTEPPPKACPRCQRKGRALMAVPSCVCSDGRPLLPRADCRIISEGWR